MKGYAYILTNKHNRVLYTGVTNDLKRRLVEHAQGASWFTFKYKTEKLVYYEYFENIEDAVAREKRLKNMPRAKKISLIDTKNETWQDLTETLH